MKERANPFHEVSRDLSANEMAADSGMEVVSVTQGTYCDPSPRFVDGYLNKRFKDPRQHIEATLMASFQIVGVVRTIKEIEELSKSLEKTGLLPDGAGTYTYLPTDEECQFLDQRSEQLFIELQEGNDARNSILLRVRAMTDLRETLSKDHIADLAASRREYRQRYDEFPPAMRVMMAMARIIPPVDPANKPSSEMPESTRQIAPDVYWLMFLAETGSKAQTQQDAEVA